MVVRVTFSLRFDPCGDIAPTEPLRGRTDPFQEDKAAHVVDDVGQPNFHGGPCDADGAYEQSHLRFLIGKDMLNARPDNAGVWRS